MGKESNDAEVECLKLKKAINDNHKLAQKLAGDAVERAVLVGELLGKWKELLPHGQFEPFTETHFDGSLRTAQVYLKAAKGLNALSKAQRTALLTSEDSLNGLISRLKSDESDAGGCRSPAEPSTVRSRGPTHSISDKGKPGGRVSTPTPNPASSGPASGEAADSSGRSARDRRIPAGESASSSIGERDTVIGGSSVQPGAVTTAVPGGTSFGTCPNCGGKKWTEDEFGATCAKCNQPHGEPVGDQDEGRIGTERAKTVKTVEALMRAFDDLNRMLARPEHVEAMASCKFLLKTARAWK